MKFLLFSIVVSAMTMTHAASLQDSDFYDYEVFFTNPICKHYKYDEQVYSINGRLLDGKPKNVYCKQSDFSRNARRESSPHFNLIKLIEDENVNEMFLSFLSFSNSGVAKALCKAIEKRNVKLTFIIDSKNREREGADRNLQLISKCRAQNLPRGTRANVPSTMFRGNQGGLGYAHNKIILAKYKNSNKVKIVYASANMSSGTILHHENWHFVTTNEDTYFYQAHVCLQKGMLQAKSRTAYIKYIKSCRAKIDFKKEDDIDFFIVPTDGKEATNKILSNLRKSKSIDMAVHRFTHNDLVRGLVREAKRKDIRFIADDDIYWSGIQGETVGSNMVFEYRNVIKLVKAKVNVKYMETNQNSRLLHHNKYIIFNYDDGTGAVHAGAGNFTKAAFSKNFENFYFIKIPSVVEAFRKQYDYVYNRLATSYSDMPVQYVMP